MLGCVKLSHFIQTGPGYLTRQLGEQRTHIKASRACKAALHNDCLDPALDKPGRGKARGSSW